MECQSGIPECWLPCSSNPRGGKRSGSGGEAETLCPVVFVLRAAEEVHHGKAPTQTLVKWYSPWLGQGTLVTHRPECICSGRGNHGHFLLHSCSIIARTSFALETLGMFSHLDHVK